MRGHIRADPSSGFLPFTTSDSITVSIDGDAPTTQRDLVYTSWYFNGLRSYQFGTSISSLLKLPTGVTQSLTIDNPTPLHAGTYETLLLLNPSSYLQQFGCPNEYPNFIISNKYRAGVHTIIVDKTAVDLKYYGGFIIIYIPNYCKCVHVNTVCECVHNLMVVLLKGF